MIRYFQDMAVNPLLLSGLFGGFLASLACGAIGPYVIVRRIVFLSAAIAHIVIGGIGAALFVRYWFAPAFDWLEPIHGALVSALAAAVLLGIVQYHARERLDTLIGALWAVGMAAGLLMVKFTPGYHVELFSYLFGNLAVIDWSDVVLIAVLDVIILAAVVVFHKRVMSVCLDEQFTRLQGISVLATNLVMLILVALTVVALTRVVGLILVIALLTLPAAAAGHCTRRFGPMILLSAVMCVLLTLLPRVAVYGTRISPESAIVLAAGAVYLVVVLLRAVPLRRIAARRNARRSGAGA